MKENFYAVLTGDLVGSSKLDVDLRHNLVTSLHNVFSDLKRTSESVFLFQSFRGDSFQCVLSDVRQALKTSIIIRASILNSLNNLQRLDVAPGYSRLRMRRQSFDARIAIGIGAVDYLPDRKGVTGIGRAFSNSGLTLDAMKGEQRLRIRSEWENLDEELNVAFALMDVLITKWSPSQAIAIKEELGGLTQNAIADRLGVTQAAVQQRLKNAGGSAISQLCSRYENLINATLGNVHV